ncbi:MAG: methyltransferase domain-containing protein [Clostridiales bacterium]
MINTTDIEYCNPFDKMAPDFWMKIEHLARYNYANDLIKKYNIRNVLDVGCADAYGTIELSKETSNVIGVDNSDKLINLAKENIYKKNITNIDLVHCDLEKEKLSLKIDKKIDFIVCFETLEHLSNPGDVLCEYKNILNLNSHLLISVPNEAFEAKNDDGTPRNPYHKQLFKEKDISNLIKNAGFKIKRYLYQPYTNIFFNKEIKLTKDEIYKSEELNNFYKHDENSIRYFANLFGKPESKLKKESYSIIIHAVI